MEPKAQQKRGSSLAILSRRATRKHVTVPACRRPDNLSARARAEWAQSLASLAAITGQLFILEDLPPEDTPRRTQLLRQCLPPLTTLAGGNRPLRLDITGLAGKSRRGTAAPHSARTADTDKQPCEPASRRVEGALGSTWAIHLRNEFRSWCVVGRFADMPLPACKLQLQAIGLDAAQTYHVFDFWAQKAIGAVAGEVVCDKLKRGGCQVLAFVPASSESGRPQLLASTRHISMDAITVRRMRWDGRRTTVDCQGEIGTRETYWFSLPAGKLVREVLVNGAPAGFEQKGPAVAVLVEFAAIELALVLILT